MTYRNYDFVESAVDALVSADQKADRLEDELDEARAEIERLRLTDAEREAVERAIRDAESFGNPNNALVPLEMLRGLLERVR